MKTAEQILRDELIGKVFLRGGFDDEPNECTGKIISRVYIGQEEAREDGVLHLEFGDGKSCWVYGNEPIHVEDSKGESK